MRLIPMKPFEESRIEKVWNHFWRFPSISSQSLQKIFKQMTGF
jgi:hypothetical protein